METEILYNDIRHKKVQGDWWFFVVKGDGGILKDKSWYQVANKEVIDILDNRYFRLKKLERINDGRLVK